MKCIRMLILSASISSANAEVADIDNSLQTLLDTDFNDFLIYVRNHPSGGATTPLDFRKPIITEVKLLPLSIMVSSSGDAAIPDSIRRVKYLAYNCTSQEQSIKGELTLKYSVGYNSVINKTISSKTKAGLSFPLGGSGVSIGFDNTIDTNLNGTLTTNKFHEENDNEKIDQAIQPMKSRLFILQRTINSGYYKFSGKVLADAVIDPPGKYSNLLSDIFFNPKNKDPKLRTFNVDGTVWDVSSSVSKVFYWIDSDLSIAECESIKKSYSLPSGVFLVKNIESQQVTIPLIDGITIKTSNENGRIEVRSKSISKEMCKVDIATIDHKMTIDAPPNNWSDWITFITHEGQSTYSLESKTQDNNDCLGKTITQVRYQSDY